MTPTTHTPLTSPGATSSGLGSTIPTLTNGKYHDETPFVRCLTAASAGRKLWASALQIPHFFPAQSPLGAILLYVVLILAGVYSGMILSGLTALSGNMMLAVGTPVLISVLEFIVVPVIKYGSLRDKQVALLKAFTAADRAARDAATHAARAWGVRDYLAALILIACFAAKVVVLLHFGAYQPAALLAWNYTIAAFDLVFHMSGLTTRVPCWVLARTINNLLLRRRRSNGFRQMGEDGKPVLGGLPFREFNFTTVGAIRVGEVDGHVIVDQGSDASGYHYTLFSPGTLDDQDRDAFLNRQPNLIAQTELARILAGVQLELLTAPEMRPMEAGPASPPPVPPAQPKSSIHSMGVA